MVKNNVTRFLDAKKVAYVAYELSNEKRGAEETARILGVPLAQVYKTIVVKRQRGKSVLVVISGEFEVDLKKVAKMLGEKKVFLPTQAEAEKMTKLQAGGISPLALMNKGFDVLLDDDAYSHESIHLSGGQRSLNIRLPVDDLIRLTRAKVGDFRKG